jgi:hypothetical protein
MAPDPAALTGSLRCRHRMPYGPLCAAGLKHNACMMCGEAATMQPQCSASPVDHLLGTATMSGNLTARRHAADRVQRGRMMR